MPRGKAIKSKRQLKFMYAAAGGKSNKISSKVAKKLIKETTRKRRSRLMKGKTKPKKKS
jgi:hypothetical protein